MATRQNRATEATPTVKNRPKTDSLATFEVANERPEFFGIPGSAISLAADGTIHNQASQLANLRLQSAKRQAIAHQTGRLLGNRNLQKVVTSLRQIEKLPSQPILRFVGEEHRQLGAEASGGETLDIDLGDGTRLTYGEMVALAGDYFESVEQITDLAPTQTGRAELRWARWDAMSAGSEPVVSPAVKERVLDRYYRFAADNISHFSAGGTARNDYESVHEEAIRLAFFAGACRDSTNWSQMRIKDAFSNHFLTDMLSSGHVRTPREQRKRWYRENFPDSLDRFVTYAANQITSSLDELGDIPWYWPNFMVKNNLKARIIALGGCAMESFSLGDVVSLAFHDQDNVGLGVVSDVDPTGAVVSGGFHWTAKGDSHLAESNVTREITVAAERASLTDLDLASESGQRASGEFVCLRMNYAGGWR